MLRKAANHDEGRAAIAEGMRGLLDDRPRVLEGLGGAASPYEDIGRLNSERATFLRKDVVFISGRFRSGSTLLWSIFRQLNGVTAYYEPLNERRWFDAATRGDRVDASHRGVRDYFREYDGLEDIGPFYREQWIRRNLFMGDQFWDPALKRYIELLIERASGRPVLQFNRVDFRLPWLRRNFPHARIVHLVRHPRDQWCSSLLDKRFGPHDGALHEFRHCDGFYLNAWVNDLQYHFPFLADEAKAHPYRSFYLLWKLSYLFGRKYADIGLRFEDLIEHPRDELERLLGELSLDVADWTPIEAAIERPEIGRWKHYADDRWFRRHEIECESILADFLGRDSSSIKNYADVIAQ